MERNDMLKILALAVSAIFVFEMFALGLLGGQRNVSHDDQQVYSGMFEVSGRVVSFGGYVSVWADENEVKELVDDSGYSEYISSYIPVPSENKTIVYLTSSTYTANLSRLLMGNGYKVYTEVRIELPKNITVQGMSIDTNDQVITLKAPPVVHLGDELKLRFLGYVQGGKLVYIEPQSIKVEPYDREITVNLRVKEIHNVRIDVSNLTEKQVKEVQSLCNCTHDQTDDEVVYSCVCPGMEEYVSEHNLRATTSAVLYTTPPIEMGVYDPITFSYPLPGIHEVNESVRMKVDLTLDWGHVVDIKGVEYIGQEEG